MQQLFDNLGFRRGRAASGAIFGRAQSPTLSGRVCRYLDNSMSKTSNALTCL